LWLLAATRLTISVSRAGLATPEAFFMREPLKKTVSSSLPPTPEVVTWIRCGATAICSGFCQTTRLAYRAKEELLTQVSLVNNCAVFCPAPIFLFSIHVHICIYMYIYINIYIFFSQFYIIFLFLISFLRT
jgi:hypothetical protein